jgi:hypothetical protein
MTYLDRCYAIVERYNKKVKLYEKRKRGNPPSVLKAMKVIRGMQNKTWCECCKQVGPVELNHLNGWKDYSIDKLIFLCKKCHLNYHREERMANRINWAGKHGDDLVTFVNSSNMSTRDAVSQYRENIKNGKIAGIPKGVNISQAGLENAFYKHRGRMNKKSGIVTHTKSRNRVMTTSEFFGMYEFLRKSGITLLDD